MVNNTKAIVTNFSELRKELQKMAVTSPSVAKAVARELGELAVVVGKSSGIVPKRTGNLRSTLRVEVEKDSTKFVAGGIVGNPTKSGVAPKIVDYAYYVNRGTSKQAPQFFMERSLALAFTHDDAMWRQVLESWIRASKI